MDQEMRVSNVINDPVMDQEMRVSNVINDPVMDQEMRVSNVINDPVMDRMFIAMILTLAINDPERVEC
jgi:hypothetical protein